MVKTLFQKGVDSTVQWELPICEFFDPACPLSGRIIPLLMLSLATFGLSHSSILSLSPLAERC